MVVSRATGSHEQTSANFGSSRGTRPTGHDLVLTPWIEHRPATRKRRRPAPAISARSPALPRPAPVPPTGPGEQAEDDRPAAPVHPCGTEGGRPELATNPLLA